MRSILFLSLSAFSLTACDVDVEEGSVEAPQFEMKKGDVDMPKVKIEGGNLDMPTATKTKEGELKMPNVDVTGPDVDVGTKTVEMKVPTVSVKAAKEGQKGDMEKKAEQKIVED